MRKEPFSVHGFPKYSYDWALNVVLAFVERYTRATDLFAKIADIPREKLLSYLISCVRCDKQIRWESMKRVIKSLNAYDFADFRKMDLQDRRNYLKYVKYEAEDFVLDDENCPK